MAKGIETFPMGEELVGFESLTPSQQQASSALLKALIQGLTQQAPAFTYPSFDYPSYAAPSINTQAPVVPNLAPAPITLPEWQYQGVNPADVGNLSDMIASLPGINPEVQQTLSTLMQGASAGPAQTLEEIVASIPLYGGELGGKMGSAMQRALSGKFPEGYFRASIAGPAREQFREETAPSIREEFAGPGTFWGTARAGAVTREQGKMESNLAAIRGELGNQAQERSLQAAAVSINARQNQINQALQELASQRNFASDRQVTALNAATAQLQAEQNNATLAVNELNRLSQGKYQEVSLAMQQYQTEVGALQQQQALGTQAAYNQAQLGQQGWATGLQAQLGLQAQGQQAYQQAQQQAQDLYMMKFQTAYNAYIAQHPSMAESIQAVLNYLGIPMLATYQKYDEGGSNNNAIWRNLTQTGGV